MNVTGGGANASKQPLPRNGFACATEHPRERSSWYELRTSRGAANLANTDAMLRRLLQGIITRKRKAQLMEGPRCYRSTGDIY